MQAKAVMEVSNLLEKAASHASTLRDAADQLFHQHHDPFLIRAPAHDVPTALDVLQTGLHPCHDSSHPTASQSHLPCFSLQALPHTASPMRLLLCIKTSSGRFW